MYHYAVCPAIAPATGEPCGHAHGQIPQRDGSAICWCARHRVWWLCGETVAAAARCRFDESKERIWSRIRHYKRVQGKQCSADEMQRAAEMELQEHGLCPGCGHIDGHFLLDGQLWLLCVLCSKRWRWKDDNRSLLSARYNCHPASHWVDDVAMKYEDATHADFERLAERLYLPPAVQRRRTSFEESLATEQRERHSRPRCPELEHPDSEPVVGVCPQCGLASGWLKIGAQTWCYCEEHKTRWHVDNSHSGAHDAELWKANAGKLAGYEIVEPAHCQDRQGRPSLTKLIHAEQEGKQRDRQKAGFLI